jgi:hypothetical protein
VKLLVFGLGYCALHYVTTRAVGERVGGTARSADKARQLHASQPNIEPFVFNPSETGAALEERVASATHLLISIPPSESADPVLAHFADAIANARDLDRIVYLSTIGVYGDADGAWIDEDAPTQPNSTRNHARVNGLRSVSARARKSRFCVLPGFTGRAETRSSICAKARHAGSSSQAKCSTAFTSKTSRARSRRLSRRVRPAASST